MGQVAKLIFVSANNNNKFYDMTEDNGEIKVTYGRVGVTATNKMYPMHKWDSIFKSKIKKGYKDVTALRTEEESIDFQSISSDAISQIVTELQALANRSIRSNYTVSSDAVTQKQIDEAQELLDKLAKLSALPKKKLTASNFNDMLLDLYQTIPRKMQRVQDHLWYDTQDPEQMVATEQATLDVMKGQVRVNTVKQDNTVDDKKTILEAMGLEIETVNDDDIHTIKKELGEISDKFRRAFRIINKRTQERFDKFTKKAKNKKRRLFWHGSRNENWWSILDGGLVLRPTNSVITGKMYGEGLYFSDKARKSYGYTSCRGSYWARGSSSKGFMAMYDVHLGNSYTSKRREHWMGNATSKTLKEQGDYDSLSAIGGVDLINNEFIIYDEAQCTVRYLVEID